MTCLYIEINNIKKFSTTPGPGFFCQLQPEAQCIFRPQQKHKLTRYTSRALAWSGASRSTCWKCWKAFSMWSW